MPDRLLLDTMLGKLATYLRMCGYDAAHALDEEVESDAVLLESRDVADQLGELADAGLRPRPGRNGGLAVFRLRPALLAGQPPGRRGRDARRPVARRGPSDGSSGATNVEGDGDPAFGRVRNADVPAPSREG
jgi:hypothetical protein